MTSDFAIVSQGMAVLREKLGIVEAEKFISIINREKIDYTTWRENLWKGKTLDEVYNDAVDYFKRANE